MTATTIRVQMAQRKDTAANWTAANPILLSGEIGYETDTKKFKIGNGSTNWNSLAYLPIPDGSGNLTITGNLEIGSTGSLTFEGSTADGFETTLAVTNPTADRTITLPNQSGNVLVSGNASIIDADIAANAEIAVSKLADGTARQLLQTDAAGTGVEWASNVDIPGTLDVTGAATFDAAVTVAGDLTVNGTTTTISTQNLLVEDKNIIIGDVASPTDVTADGGGITLKGATDKTINWIDATDAWTSSERFSVPLGTAALPSLTFTGDPNTGIYSPGADQVAISTSGAGRLFVDASGNVGVGASSPTRALDVNGSIQLPSNNALYINGSNNYLYADPTATELASATLIKFVANGSERLRITSAGFVGIGTSSPTTNFHIGSGAGGNDLGLLLSRGATTNFFEAHDGTKNFIAGTDSSNAFVKVGSLTNDPVAIVQSNATAIYIDTSKRVGIGTTSPSYLLDVASSVAQVGNSTDAFIQYKSTAGNWHVGANSSNAYVFYAGTYGSGTERARIDSSGRLGIGTSSPNGRLDVADGDAYITKNSGGDASGVTSQSLYIKTQSGNLARLYSVSQGSGGPGGFGGDFRIQTKADNGALADRFTINYLGSVGIGTTSPNSVLQVNSGTNLGGILVGFNSGSSNFYDADLQVFRSGNGTERARIDSSGRLLVGTSSDSGGALLQVNGDRVRIATAKTPASATDTGTAGEICWDASYVYVCTATNTWKRSALSTW